MGAVGFAAALVLASVFVWAGAAKLARPAATASAFGSLGVPRPALAARSVPAAELALAALLIARPRVGGLAATAVLAVFTLVLLRALGSGSTAGCNCFGRAHPEPVSRRDVARNASLLALALMAATAGPG